MVATFAFPSIYQCRSDFMIAWSGGRPPAGSASGEFADRTTP
jgi:hypothetical protein